MLPGWVSLPVLTSRVGISPVVTSQVGMCTGHAPQVGMCTRHAPQVGIPTVLPSQVCTIGLFPQVCTIGLFPQVCTSLLFSSGVYLPVILLRCVPNGVIPQVCP